MKNRTPVIGRSTGSWTAGSTLRNGGLCWCGLAARRGGGGGAALAFLEAQSWGEALVTIPASRTTPDPLFDSQWISKPDEGPRDHDQRSQWRVAALAAGILAAFAGGWIAGNSSHGKRP